MKILVTGANGQLGKELQNVLEDKMPGLTFYTDIDTLDLTDQRAVEKFILDNDITHIINCAAYTNVDKAEEEKMLCHSVNVNAVKNLALAADKNGSKIIHISTDYVFDGKGFRPYKESDKVNPISQYGTTKRAGETALIALSPDCIIIRTAWLYSPYGKNFVKTMINLGREKKELRVVCDQIGSPTYALELANAIYAILTAHQWVPGVYHFTGEGVCSWYDFSKAIHRFAGITSCEVKPIPTEDYPTLATRPFYSVLDRSRIKATYDINIPHWVESLVHCIERIKKEEQNVNA